MKKQARKLLVVLMAVGLSLGVTGMATAADTITQTATYEVSPINEISVSGQPGALIINAAVAGSAPTAVTDATTSYAITTNEIGKKITAGITTDMPAGLTLNMALVAPAGGVSTARDLTGVAQDMVTGISTLNETGLGISYTFSATSAAGVITSAAKTVTFTIADGS